MPNYKLVTIGDAATKALAWVEAMKAKDNARYEGITAQVDAKILAGITKLATAASQFTKGNAEYVEGLKKQGKAWIARLAKLVEQPEFERADLVKSQRIVEQVLELRQMADKDNQRLTAALAPQYRQNAWIEKSRKALHDPSKLKPLQDNRAREVKLGTATIQQTRRLEEYESRAKVLLKEAGMRFKSNAALFQVGEDIQDIAAKMEADHKFVDDLVYKTRTKTKNITALKGKAAPEGKVAKLYIGYIPDLEGTGKEIRGRLKTMKGRYDSVEKRSKALTSKEAKAQIGPALKAAKAKLDAAQKISDDYGDELKKVLKIAEAVFGKAALK